MYLENLKDKLYCFNLNHQQILEVIAFMVAPYAYVAFY